MLRGLSASILRSFHCVANDTFVVKMLLDDAALEIASLLLRLFVNSYVVSLKIKIPMVMPIISAIHNRVLEVSELEARVSSAFCVS